MASKQTSKDIGTFPHENWQVPGEVPPPKSARPQTDTSPGSDAYKLTGPLAAKVAPERPKQGVGSL